MEVKINDDKITITGDMLEKRITVLAMKKGDLEREEERAAKRACIYAIVGTIFPLFSIFYQAIFGENERIDSLCDVGWMVAFLTIVSWAIIAHRANAEIAGIRRATKVILAEWCEEK